MLLSSHLAEDNASVPGDDWSVIFWEKALLAAAIVCGVRLMTGNEGFLTEKRKKN